MRRVALAVPAMLAFLTAAGTAASQSGSVQEYSGLLSSSFDEDVFVPCNIPGIADGWAVRYKNARDGTFLSGQLNRPGYPPARHFVHVRGKLSEPGHYGLGFQTRELLVDRVLAVSEVEQPCPSYEALPEPWQGIAHKGSKIVGVAVRDDKKVAALVDGEGLISVWDLERGKLLKEFSAQDPGRLTNVFRVPMSFSRDGKLLAVTGTDNVIRIWRPLDAKIVRTLARVDTLDGRDGNGNPVTAYTMDLVFNQSGTLLAAPSNGPTNVWSLTTGKWLGKVPGRGYGRLQFMGDSAFLATADSGQLRIFPSLGAREIWTGQTPGKNFYAMARSSDGRWLLTSGWGNRAYLFSVLEGKVTRTFVVPPFLSGLGAVAFSPDGNTVAVAGGATGLYLWDTRTGAPIRSFRKFPGEVLYAWFTPDGRSIATYSTADQGFKVVHLDPQPDRKPAQVWWGIQRIIVATPGAPLGDVYGIVIRPQQNAVVIPGAEVTVYDGEQPGSSPIGRGWSGADGRVRIANIRVPHLTIRVRKPGYREVTRYLHLPSEAGFQADLLPDSVAQKTTKK